MELPSVSSLEFSQIRESIKNYIKSKTDFQDYDFEGSNLSMLIDVLAYNTMYSSYNINMAANELNLDTAVLRDNIVSHAKRLGYTPNSYVCSKVTYDITVSNLNTIGPFDEVYIASGPVFTTTQNGKTHTFILRNNLRISPESKDTITFKNIVFEEGTEYSIRYTVDESNENQRYFIPNNFVDSNTIKVSIISDATSNVEDEYTKKNSIVGVKGSDKVFFVEETQDQKYEVIFGDNAIGRKLENGEIIIIRYIVTNGEEANNISNLNFVGTVYGVTQLSETVIAGVNITTSIVSEKSDGGSNFESIKSIKYRAPRYFSSQQRAVTISDYESIIQNIYSNADIIKVTGGETYNPPQYGKVFISIKPKIGDLISEFEKKRIINEIKNYTVGSITPVILDSEPFFIVINPIVVYEPTKTRKSKVLLDSLIQQTVSTYNLTDDFKNFNGIYSSSKLLCDIRDIDSSIKFVGLKTYFRKPVKLYQNVEYEYKVKFYTKLKYNIDSKYTLISEPFCHLGLSDAVFLGAFGNDFSGCESDNNIYLLNSRERVIGVVGTINYETGEVSFVISPCQNTPINIYVIPDNPDITTGENVYPSLEIVDIDTIDYDDYKPSDLDTSVGLPITVIDVMPGGDPGGVPTETNTPGTTVSNPDGSTTTTNSDGSTTTTNPDGSTDTNPPFDDGGEITPPEGPGSPTIDDFTPDTPSTCS